MKIHLHTDHHFVTGYRHLSDGKPCQDHAMSGVVTDDGEIKLAYAVVSDGCSSGGETDIGARLMTAISAKHFRENYCTGDREILIEKEVWDAADMLGLQDDDLLATHLYAAVDCDGAALIVIRGDGVVVFLDRFGTPTIFRYEWAKEAPHYPMQSNLNGFYRLHGGADAKALKISCWKPDQFGVLEQFSENEQTVEEACRGQHCLMPDASDLSAIILFSDGVCKVDKIDWLDAIEQLIAFKDRKGIFAKRRMMRFVRDAMKLGHGPIDDLSYAVISIQPESADPFEIDNGHLSRTGE